MLRDHLKNEETLKDRSDHVTALPKTLWRPFAAPERAPRPAAQTERCWLGLLPTFPAPAPFRSGRRKPLAFS